MLKNENKRAMDIAGHVERSIANAGDNNVFNLVYNLIYKQTDTKLSAGWIRLITTVSLATFSTVVTIILLAMVLFTAHFTETKVNMTFPQLILMFFAAWSFTFFFLLKVQQNVKILIVILIPLCMAFSVASAAYLLDENVFHIIERIILSSDEKEEIKTPQHDSTPDKYKTQDVGKSDHPKVEQPKPEKGKGDQTQKSPVRKIDEKPAITPKPSVHGRVSKPPYSLRSQPMSVSNDDAERIFGLRKDENIWTTGLLPIECIENDFKDNGNRTITDHATGLMWQQSGSDNGLTHENAKAYIDALNRQNFAGHSDWRLPTVDELKSLLTSIQIN